jgi:hypothetical protein
MCTAVKVYQCFFHVDVFIMNSAVKIVLNFLKVSISHMFEN